MIGIYKITSPSGKIYIGQTWDTSKRFSKYRKGNSAANRQKERMSKAKKGIPHSEQHRLNIIKAREGRRNLTEEQKQRMKGKKMPDHVKAALIKACTGRVLTEDHRKKIADGIRKHWDKKGRKGQWQ